MYLMVFIHKIFYFFFNNFFKMIQIKINYYFYYFFNLLFVLIFNLIIYFILVHLIQIDYDY